MSTENPPHLWVVVHIRTDHDDDDESQAQWAYTQEEAYELALEMACVTESQRVRLGLFLPQVDILELVERLKELTGDIFMIDQFANFVSKRAKRELPASLQIEALLEPEVAPVAEIDPDALIRQLVEAMNPKQVEFVLHLGTNKVDGKGTKILFTEDLHLSEVIGQFLGPDGRILAMPGNHDLFMSDGKNLSLFQIKHHGRG